MRHTTQHADYAGTRPATALHTTTTGAVPAASVQRSRHRAYAPTGRRPIKALALALACVGTVLLAAQLALAFGITPVKATYEFIPGGTASGSFSVINDEGLTGKFTLSTEGDMADAVVLDADVLPLSEKTVKINYQLRFTTDYPEPGDHIVKIYAQLVNEDTTGVGAVVRLVHKVIIRVPPKGSRAAIDLEIGESNTSLIANATVRNTGAVAVVDPKVSFEIADDTGFLSTGSSTGETLDVGQSGTFIAVFERAQIPPGIYSVTATMVYGNNTADVSRSYTVGVPDITIANITGVVQEGDLSPYNMLVTSDWNQELPDVYADITALEGDTVVKTFTTETLTLPPRGAVVFRPAFDGRDMQVANLTMKIDFHVGQRTYELFEPLEIVPKEVYKVLAAKAEQSTAETPQQQNLNVVAFVLMFIVLDIIAILAWRMWRDS